MELQCQLWLGMAPPAKRMASWLEIIFDLGGVLTRGKLNALSHGSATLSNLALTHAVCGVLLNFKRLKKPLNKRLFS